jgi:hypothetical protein
VVMNLEKEKDEKVLRVRSIIGGRALLAERAEERPDTGSKALAHLATFSEEASWRDWTRRAA